MFNREGLAKLGRELRARAHFYQAIYRDPRTPLAARVLLWMAIGYTLLPFDLIPDFLPVIGHLDDAVIVPALLLLALYLVPEQVKQAHNQNSEVRKSAAHS